jgi:rod shape-determining protein MreD
MSVRVATVVLAVVAALLETSVAPYISATGLTPDLVLVCAVGLAVFIGSEEGFLAAFVGGIILDILIAPVRPLGATTLSLLVAVGIGVSLIRFIGPGRIHTMLILVFGLTFVLRALLAGVMMLATEAQITVDPLGTMLPAAILNTAIAVPLALIGRRAWFRWGERAEW